MSAYEAAIRNEIDYWPGVRVEFSKRAKHNQAVLHYAGKSRFVVFPDTPGDERRGALNCLADVRRELASIGAAKVARKPSVRNRKHKVIGNQHPPRVFMPHVERAPVKVNPFDALASLLHVEAAPVVRLPWWRRLASWLSRKAPTQ